MVTHAWLGLGLGSCMSRDMSRWNCFHFSSPNIKARPISSCKELIGCGPGKFMGSKNSESLQDNLFHSLCLIWRNEPSHYWLEAAEQHLQVRTCIF